MPWNRSLEQGWREKILGLTCRAMAVGILEDVSWSPVGPAVVEERGPLARTWAWSRAGSGGLGCGRPAVGVQGAVGPHRSGFQVLWAH